MTPHSPRPCHSPLEHSSPSAALAGGPLGLCQPSLTRIGRAPQDKARACWSSPPPPPPCFPDAHKCLAPTALDTNFLNERSSTDLDSYSSSVRPAASEFTSHSLFLCLEHGRIKLPCSMAASTHGDETPSTCQGHLSHFTPLRRPLAALPHLRNTRGAVLVGGGQAGSRPGGDGDGGFGKEPDGSRSGWGDALGPALTPRALLSESTS